MNEWKELKIDNLPSDWVTGEYEIQIKQGYGWEGARAEDDPNFRIMALQDLKDKKLYRVDYDSGMEGVRHCDIVDLYKARQEEQ